MNSTPLISIITPSFNQAAFLEYTLRSVFAQDFPVEYLVVDGGSQDGSQEIIRRYAGRLAWWVSEPDRGQAEAINKGFQKARGEIIAWLNSDDLYLPGAIPQAMAALQAEPELGLVYGNAITIDPQGRLLNRLTFGEWGLAELASFRIICQPAVFMRRSVLEKAGGLEPSYHFMLDHHLWIRMARLAPIRHIPAWWAAARHHPGAKNVSQAAGFGREIFRILEWMKAQPEFKDLLASRRRQVQAGATRLAARYLLDGNRPGEALRLYGRALSLDPAYTLQHWHRMVYALISLAGLGDAAGWYFRLRQAHRKNLQQIPGLEGWPGLTISENLK